MTRGLRTALSTVLLTASVFVTGGTVAVDSQTPIVSPTFRTPSPNTAAQCLHGADETTEQKERRRQGIALARIINTAQARQRGSGGTFFDTATLLAQPDVARIAGTSGNQLIQGWRLEHVASGDGYVFSIKDTLDPCGFAFFSDAAGIIYTAEPIR